MNLLTSRILSVQFVVTKLRTFLEMFHKKFSGALLKYIILLADTQTLLPSYNNEPGKIENCMNLFQIRGVFYYIYLKKT